MRRFGLMTGVVLCLGFPAAAGAASPSVTTGGATSVTRNSAVLNATINPGGQRTVYVFQYGLTTAYGAQTARKSAGSGTANVAVKTGISKLTSGTVYHYRVVATNAQGTSTGKDRQFKTAGQPPAPPGVFTGGDPPAQPARRDDHRGHSLGEEPGQLSLPVRPDHRLRNRDASVDRPGPAVPPARELHAHRPGVPSDLPLPPVRVEQGRDGGRRRPALHHRARASGPGDAQHPQAPPQRPPLGAEDGREAEHSARLPRPSVVHGNRAGPIPHRPPDRAQHQGAARWRLPVLGLDGHQRPARGLADPHRAPVPGQ